MGCLQMGVLLGFSFFDFTKGTGCAFAIQGFLDGFLF